MKGHPQTGRPRGALLKEVNALVAAVYSGCSEQFLIETLGKPDERLARAEHTGATEIFASLGSSFSFGDAGADCFLAYVDPYRQRRTYVFGIASGRVVSQEQVSRAEPTKSD